MTSTTSESHPLGALADDAGALGRLVKSIVADELARIRGRSPGAAETHDWTYQTTLDEDGLGVDSLMRLQIASRLDLAFHLNVVGVEDYLLLAPTLGEWVELIAEGLRRGPGEVAFRTSGSTGQPRTISHAAVDLAEEIRAYPSFLGAAERVVTLVPPHHLYGFLFTVLAPALEGTEVVDLCASPPSSLTTVARPGDRIIGTPFLWQLVFGIGRAFPPGVTGVTSGGACPPDLFEAGRSLGLSRFVDIYGSTETAGLGWRGAAVDGFEAMPHLELIDDEPVRFRRRSGRGMAEPPDHLERLRSGRLLPMARKDGMVQIAGRNVDPAHVRRVVAEHPDVVDCSVRVENAGAESRLKAFVVPRRHGLLAAADVANWCDARLSAPERPVRFTFGEALPRNAMGKLVDWPD